MLFCTPNKLFFYAQLLSDRGAVSGKNLVALVNARERNIFFSTSAYSWFISLHSWFPGEFLKNFISIPQKKRQAARAQFTGLTGFQMLF